MSPGPGRRRRRRQHNADPAATPQTAPQPPPPLDSRPGRGAAHRPAVEKFWELGRRVFCGARGRLAAKSRAATSTIPCLGFRSSACGLPSVPGPARNKAQTETKHGPKPGERHPSHRPLPSEWGPCALGAPAASIPLRCRHQQPGPGAGPAQPGGLAPSLRAGRCGEQASGWLPATRRREQEVRLCGTWAEEREVQGLSRKGGPGAWPPPALPSYLWRRRACQRRPGKREVRDEHTSRGAAH